MPLALAASDAMAATSRSPPTARAFSTAWRARLVIEASGVCSSFTTLEISRPMAAIFSVRKSCSCTLR